MSRNVLIIKPSSLGDVANALAVVPRLRRLYPGCTVHWLVNAEYEGLVLAAGVDRALLFRRASWKQWSRMPSGLGNLMGLLRTLRRERYDVVLDLQGLFRSGFFARATGAPIRIGFADAREMAPMFYTHRVEARRHFTHAVDACLAVMRGLGDTEAKAAWEWPGLDALAHGVHEAWGTVPRQYFVFVPGARHAMKRWPEEQYAAAVARCWKRYRQRVVLVGDRSEEEMCIRIKHGAVQQGADGSAVLPLAGRLTLAELAALCRDSRLVLSNDTGVLHLAVAAGAPVLALMGPTRPEGHGPHGQANHVVAAHMDCVPCQGTKRTCRDKGACMATITVDEVMDTMERIIEGTI